VHPFVPESTVPITTTPDHVAVAVPAVEAAAARWRDELGGGWVAPSFPNEAAGFASRQLRYANGAKLELLEPLGVESFAARFVAKYGARIHHVTLKVDALLPAVDQLRADGFDVVDVFAEGEIWHEAFLRPSQVGGLIVQIAWAGRTEDDWAELAGFTPEIPREGAARLLGPTLTHPDLERASFVWSTLGAAVRRDDDVLVARWPDAPLDVRIEAGEDAGPVGLRFSGAPALPEIADTGPRTLVA
jgi:catechol 2,3-dioxygenase-like lactoylglutathione lyase family enzyme